MILKMILKSFDFQCDFDLDFQITTSKMIWILILNHLYLGDLILILKSSTYDDFAHLCVYCGPFLHLSAMDNDRHVWKLCRHTNMNVYVEVRGKIHLQTHIYNVIIIA